MKGKLIVIILLVCYSELSSQIGSSNISVVGTVDNPTFDVDLIGNKYYIFAINHPDTFYINGQPRDELLKSKKYKFYYNNVFATKFDKEGNLLKLNHYYSNIYHGAIKVNKDQTTYMTMYSTSDSIVLNDSVLVNPEFNKAIILIKFSDKFELIKYIIFKNATPYNKIKLNNNRIFITGSYCDTLDVLGKQIVCSPITSHNSNSFICSLSEDLDSVYYLVNFGGYDSDRVYDIEVDTNNNLFFCGDSRSKYLVIGNDSFYRPDECYRSRDILGKLKSWGTLDWFYQTACRESGSFLDISFALNNNIILLGNFNILEMSIGNNKLLNPYFPKINSFLSQWTKDGNFVDVKHYYNSGSISIRDINVGPYQSYWITIGTSDTIIDVKGNKYSKEPYGNSYFCKLDDSLNIVQVNYISSSKGFGIHDIKFDNNGHLIVNLWYEGKYLIYNDSIVIDSNEMGYFKSMLFDFDDFLTNLRDSKNKLDHFIIYPNPSNGLIHIKIQANETLNFDQVRIFDVNGQLVHDENCDPFKTEFSFKSNLFQTGIYFISLFYKGKLIGIQKWINKI